MQLPMFCETVASLEIVDPIKLPDLVAQIKGSLASYAGDLPKLNMAMNKLCEIVMKFKDIKNEYLSYYQELICEVFNISAKNQFRVGYEGVNYVFNMNAQFYKTAGLDTSLAFPIGKERPLQQYNPAVGETCDVLRPYITSTSICGWARCIVREIQYTKYSYDFLNCNSETQTRVKPWFAPLGTRLKDYDWRMSLQVGAPIDALIDRVWYESTVAEVDTDDKCKKIKVTFRRFAEDGDRIDFLGNRYYGLLASEDEWLDVMSPRIQKPGKMVNKKLCYYTYKSDQNLLDDQYDMIFQQQYNQKPFYAISRSFVPKSTSLLTFTNLFISLGGLEKTNQFLEQEDANSTHPYIMLATTVFTVNMLPRMYLKDSVLPQIYSKIIPFAVKGVKTMTGNRIQVIYVALENIGKRLYSLSQCHRDFNTLRKCLIKQFLKMNMEKQMQALRFLSQLVCPKKPYTIKEEEELQQFFRDQKIFQQIFNTNTHQQIMSRAVYVLEYMIKHKIISAKEFASLWTIVPLTDKRGRATIQKLLIDISKNIPIEFVDLLISKILTLKETELTIDSLNLLKQLKNRGIQNELQIKVLDYLWDILTLKSANIPSNIEEQIEKVFKAYVEITKDPKIRMKVLQSMVQKLQDCKKIKNEIELLKDFIKSYSQNKQTKSQMIQQQLQNIPTTLIEAVHFIKTKGIYAGLLNQLFKQKDSTVKKDILNFISFLFENDADDIIPIIRHIYEKIGPVSIFLEWVTKISKRSTEFIIQFLEQTTDFTPFESLNANGFSAIQDLIISVNQSKKNLKILTTYKYKKQNQTSVTAGPVTGDAHSAKKQQKFIGPLLPEVTKHIYVLVSPFKIIGMKFLERLLYVIKQTSIFNSIIKLIIQFVTNLDESIQSKTEEFRREFLFDILKEIKNTVAENVWDAKLKSKLEIYINLLMETIFETQRDGLGDLVPHFEKIEGEKLALNVFNLFNNEKTKNSKEDLPKLRVVCNQNCTIWSFKKIIGQMICEAPEDIDVIKYSDPMTDANNGKSLIELLFYDSESIKIGKKAIKPIPRSDLFNEDKSDVSVKFEGIISTLFNSYKNTQVNGLRPEDLQKLSKQKWKGSLFKQARRLEVVYQTYDTDKKGYLSYQDFKKFFYEKAKSNQNAVWILINLSGYKNNFQSSTAKKQQLPIKTSYLPRKILSCPEVYRLIFEIFQNPTFKQIHLNFYRLLSMLEVNSKQTQEIESKIYSIIQKQESAFALCYSLQVVNSQLAKRSNFYYQFWQNNGIKKIQNRIQQLLQKTKSIYDLQPLWKNQILSGFIKVFHMYTSQLLSKYKIARFVNQNRLSYMELDQFVRRINQCQGPKEDQGKVTLSAKKLLQSGPTDEALRSIYDICIVIFEDILKNFQQSKGEYLSRLLGEIGKVLGSLIGSDPKYHQFNPQSFIPYLKNDSISNRRSIVNLIYIQLFHSSRPSPAIPQLLHTLTLQIPTQSKMQNSHYFALLKQIISQYLAITQKEKNTENGTGTEKANQSDQFLIGLGNMILNDLFGKVQGEERNSVITDRIIFGMLSVVDIIVNKKEVCIGLSWRMIQITQKCLFAYNIQQKLQSLKITQQMLTTPKQSQHFPNYVKCKTEQTRALAYSIVSKMHKVSPAIEPLFINNYLLPVIRTIGPDVRITRSKDTDVGIKNFGSTCYMNSMLQVLNSVGAFRNSLVRSQAQANLVKQLKKLFAALYFSQRVDYAPKDLLNAFIPPINPGLQQDTTQFLNFLFDQLESALAGTKYQKLLDQIFKGANTAQMICHSCGYKKQHRQQFFSFGVEIEGKFDLQSAMEGSYQGEIISDYLCDQCKNRGETTKRNILSQIPSVMFIHLRRIVFNYDMFVNMKIHTRLQFPQDLNIEPYTKQGVELRQTLGLQYLKNLAHNEQQAKKFQVLAEHGKPKDFYKMKLKGVIVHSGSADVGHYYSILLKDKMWYKYDDSRVGYFGSSGFESQCYGGTFSGEEWSTSSANAYVLVYQKVIKNPIQVIQPILQIPSQPSQMQAQIPPQVAQQTPSQIPAETPQQNPTPQTPPTQTPAQNPPAQTPPTPTQIPCQVRAPQPQTHIEYDKIPTYNSPQSYREFWLDNHNFMVETHLLDSKHGKGFIEFLCQIIKDSSNCFDKISLVAEVIYKISYHSGIVGDLLAIVKDNSANVGQRVFYQYVVSDKPRTFKLLFNNQKPVREFMAAFLHIIMIETYKLGQTHRENVIAYINQLLGGLTGEVAKNWLRIDGYFTLMYLLVSSSVDHPQLWKLFLDRNLISTLIDYVMEKQSPVRINPKNYSLGTKSNPMDFSSGISIISFYVKHSYGFTGKNYQIPSIPQPLLFHLNDNDVICLSSKQFYRKMLKQRQNLKTLALIIQRLSIMNLQFSREICEVLLENICSITDAKDQMQDLAIVCLEILKIRDSFWSHRAEMLVGIGVPFVANNNVMETFDEEKYTYTSTIYDIFPIECLLSYVYLYRLKNTLACFQLIKAIIQGCSVSDVAMKYLARQPSPSYLYENYLSWMQSFIKSFTDYATSDPKVKERLQGEVEHIMKYVEDLKTYMKQHPEVDFYQSLITGQIKQKNLINSNEKDGIQIRLYECEVYTVKSQPIPDRGNKTMENVLQSMRLNKSVTSDSNILRFFKKKPLTIALQMDPVVNQQEKQLMDLFQTNPTKTSSTDQPQPQSQQSQNNPPKPDQKQSSQKSPVTTEMEQQVNLEGVSEIGYFRQLEMINKTKDKKVVRIVFSSGEYPNTMIPHEMTWKIFVKNSQSFWMAKQDPTQDWGDLNMKTYVEDYIKEKHEKKNITSWWFKCYGEKQVIPQQSSQQENQEMKMKESQQPYEPKIDYQKDLDFSEINCPICTFFNPVANTTCETCGSPLH